MKFNNLIVLAIISGLFSTIAFAEVRGSTINIRRSVNIRQKAAAQQIVFQKEITVNERGTLVVDVDADIAGEICLAKHPAYNNFYCGKREDRPTHGKTLTITEGRMYLLVSYQDLSNRQTLSTYKEFAVSTDQVSNTETRKIKVVMPASNRLVISNVFPGKILMRIGFQHTIKSNHKPFYNARLRALSWTYSPR